MGSGASQEVEGVRVFKVHPGSPAAEAGLEVFFDFIISIDGVVLDPQDQQVFGTKIQEAENRAVKLVVYNTRAHGAREVIVTPRKWTGTGLLGAKVRFDSCDPADNNGQRVLEVFPNSPAAQAGLESYQDFLLGNAQAVFHDVDELSDFLQNNMSQPSQVYVYSAVHETVREVTLTPNNSWGGEGCIGCDIGTGILHRIPAPRFPVAGGAGKPSVSGLPPPTGPPGALPPPTGPPGSLPAAVGPPGALPPAVAPLGYPAGVAPPLAAPQVAAPAPPAYHLGVPPTAPTSTAVGTAGIPPPALAPAAVQPPQTGPPSAQVAGVQLPPQAPPAGIAARQWPPQPATGTPPGNSAAPAVVAGRQWPPQAPAVGQPAAEAIVTAVDSPSAGSPGPAVL